MTSELLPLAEGFPASNRASWSELASKALKGADPEKRLTRSSADGLNINPLYTSESAQALPRPPEAARLVERPQPWDIAAAHAHPDLSKTNKAILEDLAGGVSAVTLRLGGNGLALKSAADLKTALTDVHLSMAGVNLEGTSPEEAGWLLNLFEQAGAPDEVRGSLGLDPLGAWARQGDAPEDISDFLSALKPIAERTRALPKVTSLVADERWVHEAGGTNVQGLAAQLASATAYLRDLTALGLSVEEAARQISFTSVADPDLYGTVAKLRALKILWTRIIEASGGKPEEAPITLNVETSRRALTKRDPYVNILRGCAGGFAAAIGGASAITVLLFTDALGYPTERARRVARNSQVLLAEESAMGRVDDPAAGSYAFEDLTRQTAEKAWARFQNFEAEGGLLAALRSGSFASEVAEAREALATKLATRKEALTGTSEFPHLEEIPLEVEPFANEETPEASKTFPPFKPFRLSEAFEAFRDKSDEILTAKGKRPCIMLWPLGTPADDTARLTFAQNFFEALGLEAVSAGDDPAATLKETGAELAVLCSSDALYAERAEAAAKAAKQAGIKRLYLAGNPGDLKETLTAAGVDDFIAMGSNILEVGAAAYQILGDAS